MKRKWKNFERNGISYFELKVKPKSKKEERDREGRMKVARRQFEGKLILNSSQRRRNSSQFHCRDFTGDTAYGRAATDCCARATAFLSGSKVAEPV